MSKKVLYTGIPSELGSLNAMTTSLMLAELSNTGFVPETFIDLNAERSNAGQFGFKLWGEFIRLDLAREGVREENVFRSSHADTDQVFVALREAAPGDYRGRLIWPTQELLVENWDAQHAFGRLAFRITTPGPGSSSGMPWIAWDRTELWDLKEPIYDTDDAGNIIKAANGDPQLHPCFIAHRNTQQEIRRGVVSERTATHFWSPANGIQALAAGNEAFAKAQEMLRAKGLPVRASYLARGAGNQAGPLDAFICAVLVKHGLMQADLRDYWTKDGKPNPWKGAAAPTAANTANLGPAIRQPGEPPFRGGTFGAPAPLPDLEDSFDMEASVGTN